MPHCKTVQAHDDWKMQFAKAVEQSVSGFSISGAPPDKAAECLRRLLRKNVLIYTDIRVRPDRFFFAHTHLSKLYSTLLGPGLGIRFTVQYNLFGGTIVELGTSHHLEFLKESQAKGHLGCFALTESFAGVNSGLVVETVCEWDPDASEFILHTPTEDSRKVWISQGAVAEYAVVVANLVVNKANKGPHAFFVQLRKDGILNEAVTTGGMGEKTISNDLDNAWFSFNKMKLGKNALLNKYVDIVDDKYTYTSTGSGTSPFEALAQRLYTGRLVIAQSSLAFARNLFNSAREHTGRKHRWVPGLEKPPDKTQWADAPTLDSLPQLDHLFRLADNKLGRMERFTDKVQEQITTELANSALMTDEVGDAAAIAKIYCIDTAIDLCQRLKQEVGSYALMAKTGFEYLDYLYCCKFAEGESRILMQKLARDRVKHYVMTQKVRKGPSKTAATSGPADTTTNDEEVGICIMLSNRLANSESPLDTWNEHWQDVYRLADLVSARRIDEWLNMARL